MPSKETKQLPSKDPPPYVLALYDFDPCSSEETFEGRPDFMSPDVNAQLQLNRGDRLAVLSEEMDWWIYCRCLSTDKEGYVPSVICAPVCEVVADSR